MAAEDLRAAAVIVRSIFRAKAESPWGLAMNVFVNALDVVVPTVGIAVLSHAFGGLGGWSLPELLLLVGSANACIGLSLLLVGAFDSFMFVPILRSGQLESALLRPGSTVVFIAATNVRPYRVGRFIASSVVLVVALCMLQTNALQVIALLPLVIAVGTAMLSCLWFVDAAATIRFGQANDLTRNMPFVGGELASFPNGLYPLSVRLVSQLVLGIGAAIYLPIAYALGHGPNLGVFSLLLGLLILPVMVAGCSVLWNGAVRRLEREGGQ